MQKVSLVLSGGGARGIAHIGVIEELEKNGFEIVSLAGTSMGALVGAVYGLGKLEVFRDWLYGLDKLKIFSLVDFTLSSQGLVKGDKIIQKIREFTSEANIEDLPIPYAAVATDILNKKEVVFTSGDIYDAIRASISIPTVFTPVKKDDSLLVDGGVLNNIPLEHVRRQENDMLIAVDVNANVEVSELMKTADKGEKEEKSLYQKKIHDFYAHLQKINPIHKEEKLGYFDLINHTIGLMTYKNAETALEKYPPDLLVQISRDSCRTFDFYKAEELVATGRQAARKALESF
jgi:NTE family protein